MRKPSTIITTALAAATLSASVLATTPANAESATAQRLGNRSLATVLAMDGHRFDRNWGDFDVLDRAVSTVLKEKPNSPVQVLTQGRKPLTAFLPTDRAFRRLVNSLTGTAPKTERGAFTRLAKIADVDLLESVLLYHVVPGATITKRQALKADGAELPTAQGGSITVNVRGHKVFLRDADRDARNPRVVVFNINKGNKQIGHGINRVLRPIDL